MFREKFKGDLTFEIILKRWQDSAKVRKGKGKTKQKTHHEQVYLNRNGPSLFGEQEQSSGVGVASLPAHSFCYGSILPEGSLWEGRDSADLILCILDLGQSLISDW